MKMQYVLPMTLLTLLGVGIFGSAAQAEDDGVAFVGGAQNSAEPYYVVMPTQQRQAPNPTYWTWMPCPFHGTCNTCANTNCPGGKGMWTFPAVRWVLDPDYYAVPPDYGWSVPAKHAIPRQNVTYQKYYPTTWYGQKANQKVAARRYPIIAQPTDTTQMGYYYQHVPTWQPKNILPNPPHPKAWHVRHCIPGADGSYTKWVPLSNMYVPLDQIPNEAAPQPAEEAAPQPVEPEAVPRPAAPPAPPEALNVPAAGGDIRRAGFKAE
ncbi:MAG: hypothetical protein ACYTGL_16100 [Planctomycetota bacterium]|jgi:hypothetical protein